MAGESNSSSSFTLGRVFAVLWKRKPIEGKSTGSATTALVSKSLSMLTIGSTHVVATAQQPNITSRDDSCSRGFQDDVRAVLAIAAPILDAVPIAGPPLKATVGALLEILKAADQITQNKQDIKRLEEKLHRLDNHLFMVPVTPQGVSKHRDDLTQQLNVTLTTLKTLRGKKYTFRYSIVAKTINECVRDIDHYLQCCVTLDVMHMRAMMDVFVSSTPQPTASKITGIILIDATGRKHEVSMGFAKTYETFTKAMFLLLDGEKLEARIQRRYMERGRYDLCIDLGTQFVPIDGERDWSDIEPGTQVVMRVILVQEEKNRTRSYQCPRCKTWHDLEGNQSMYAVIECGGCYGRFQISEEGYNDTKDRRDKVTSEDKNGTSHDTEMGVLVNFHLKVNVPPPVRPAWRTVDPRRRSWATWLPDHDQVTPPSIEPTLVISGRASPGLFGTPSDTSEDSGLGGEYEPEWKPPGPPGPPPETGMPPRPTAPDMPAWRTVHPRRQSWATWLPDRDQVTPPSIEPTLVISGRASPGLFGTPSDTSEDSFRR